MFGSRLTGILLVMLFFLAACAGDSSPQPAATSTADVSSAEPETETPGVPAADDLESSDAETAQEATAAPSASGEDGPEVATPGRPEPVSIVARDGLQLQGTFFPAAGEGPWPSVLLLHMMGSNRAAWTATGLPEALAEQGYAVLTIDMRGHGETGSERDWLATEEDLLEVIGYLTRRANIERGRIAVVGASIGANMALRAGARDPAIPAVVLLSPGLDYSGVTTSDALAGYGGRPLLILASSEDRYAADSARTLADLAGESAQLLLYDGAGHGTNMFGPQPALIDVILDWLRENL